MSVLNIQSLDRVILASLGTHLVFFAKNLGRGLLPVLVRVEVGLIEVETVQFAWRVKVDLAMVDASTAGRRRSRALTLVLILILIHGLKRVLPCHQSLLVKEVVRKQVQSVMHEVFVPGGLRRHEDLLHFICFGNLQVVQVWRFNIFVPILAGSLLSFHFTFGTL